MTIQQAATDTQNTEESEQPDLEVDLAQLAAATQAGANAHADIDVDVDVDGQPEMTTEQIISQLTHDDQDLHDLLRSHAQAEYDAQQANDGLLPAHFSDQNLQSGVDSSTTDQPGLNITSGTGGDFGIDQALAQQIKASLDEPIVFGAGPPGSCDICQRTQTTVWRKVHLPDRDLHVCNRMSPPPLFLFFPFLSVLFLALHTFSLGPLEV